MPSHPWKTNQTSRHHNERKFRHGQPKSPGVGHTSDYYGYTSNSHCARSELVSTGAYQFMYWTRERISVCRFSESCNLTRHTGSCTWADASQPTIDGQVQTLNLYCALLVNAQGLIVHLLNQNVQNIQNQTAPRSTIKAPKPEFDGTPREKACGFITACTTYH